MLAYYRSSFQFRIFPKILVSLYYEWLLYVIYVVWRLGECESQAWVDICISGMQLLVMLIILRWNDCWCWWWHWDEMMLMLTMSLRWMHVVHVHEGFSNLYEYPWRRKGIWFKSYKHPWGRKYLWCIDGVDASYCIIV